MTFEPVVQIQAKSVVTENHYSLIAVQLPCEISDWFHSSSWWTGTLIVKIATPIVRGSRKEKTRKLFIFSPSEVFWEVREVRHCSPLAHWKHHIYYQVLVKELGTLLSCFVHVTCCTDIHKSGGFICNTFIMIPLIYNKCDYFHYLH